MSVTLESLEQELKELRKEVSSLKSGAKPERKKRKPNAFNIFVGETIPKVKAENPELSQSEAFTLATSMWKDHKEKLAQASDE